MAVEIHNGLGTDIPLDDGLNEVVDAYLTRPG